MKKISMLVVAMLLAAVAMAAETKPGSRSPLLNRGLRKPAPGNASKGPAGNASGAPDVKASKAARGTASNGYVASKTDTSFNWVGATSEMILDAYCDRVGKTPLIDPNCPKNVSITLKSPEGQRLTNEEYLEAIKAVLEMNGIHIEDYKDSFVRALPRKDVRKEGIPLLMDADAKLEDRVNVISMMIPFENMSVEDAQKVLEGFKSNSGLLISFERTNKILVTDTEQNIKRMVEIAKAIDVAIPATEQSFVRQIKNASVSDIKTVLDQIVQDSQKLQEQQKQPARQTLGPQFPANGPRGLLGRGGQNQQKSAASKSTESLLMSISDADRGIIRGRVTIVAEERSNKLVIITSKSNMDFFDKVIEALDVETTPDTVVKVYRLKYADAEDVSDMINDLIGNASSSKSNSKNQNQTAKKGTGGNLSSNKTQAQKKSVNQRSGEAKAGELSKDNTTVLADKRINGIVVMTDKDLVPTIESIIESMDIKLSQVLIETVIIEVQLGDDLATGIDWVNNNWTGKDPRVLGGGGGGSAADTLSTLSGNTTAGKSYSEWASEAKSVLQSASASTYGSNNLSTDEITKYIEAAQEFAADSGSATPIGAGITYFLKSDKLNLSAIIEASKSDSRSKYIASPVVMTVDNKEATIEATQLRYLFKGYQYSGSTYNGSAVPDYEQKDIGITVKVTPKINPNGTVMLEVEEEYSQEGAGQLVDGVSQATTVTRKMSADVLLENMQTVVLGGLTQRHQTESTTGIPILKDIPYVGKWLFGTVSQSESRNELLVFMTPYVLNDASAAEIEAIRRKKSLSDVHSWEDNGWSASKLADPVPAREILRRMKDEAKKQDEERATKKAIEEWKTERAETLKKEIEAEKAKKEGEAAQPAAEAKPAAESEAQPEKAASVLSDIDAM